jgi:hypothetical protein
LQTTSIIFTIVRHVGGEANRSAEAAFAWLLVNTGVIDE